MPSSPFLTYAAIRALTGGTPPRRVRITAAHDPLGNVPVGTFTLADYSYDGADLCQREFFNCELRSSQVA